MTYWADRPVEIANLFNPAFCAVLIDQTVKAYEREAGIGLPYALAYPVLPIILHSKTRQILPTTTRSKLQRWILNNPQVKVGFAERAKNLTTITKEAILFGLQIGVFSLSAGGHINSVPRKLSRNKWDKNTEPYECVRKAGMLGKWFALSGDAIRIYSILGIQL